MACFFSFSQRMFSEDQNPVNPLYDVQDVRELRLAFDVGEL